MRGLRLGINFGQSGLLDAFQIIFSGLTGGEAVEGDHASITFTTSPSGGTITQKWGTTPGGSELGIGASPTDYAGNSVLYLEVTRNGDVVSTSVPIHPLPVGSNLTPTVLDETSASVTYDINNNAGTIYLVVIDTGTGTINPSVAQVKAGQDGAGAAAAYDHNQGVSASGTQTFFGGATGLTEGTTYHAYAVYTDDLGNDSAVTDGGTFVPADVTAPVISSMTFNLDGVAGYTGQLNSDTGADGVIDIVITTSATAPSQAQVAAGQDHTGVPAASFIQDQAAAALGNNPYSGNDLGPSTTYYAHGIHTDANSNASDVFTSPSTVTTLAATVPDAFVDADWSVATGAATGGQLDVTIASLPDPNGAAITDVEYELDASGTWTSSGGTSDFTITGLTGSTSYDVRLRAVNSVGNAAAGNTETATSSAGGAFTPSDLFGASEEGFYFEVNPSNCFTDTARTTAASVGDSVQGMTDLSGNGRHATFSGTTPPVLRQEGTGEYYLEMGTDNAEMTLGTYSPLGSTGWGVTVAIELTADTQTETKHFVTADRSGSTRVGQIVRIDDNTDVPRSIVFNTSTTDFQAAASAITLGTPFTFTSEVTTSQIEIFIDGTSGGTTAVTGTLQTGTTEVDLFNRSGQGPEGKFYGGVMIDRPYTGSERTDTETYFGNLRP